MDEKQVPTTTTKEERRLSSRYLKLNRLPTLQEVLDRKTRPPLDLFCFYIFLQRESAEDALDFWLDVQQHENLCKAYFKDIKRSGRNIEQEWPTFAAYARLNGSHFAPLLSLSAHDDIAIDDDLDHDQHDHSGPYAGSPNPNGDFQHEHEQASSVYHSPQTDFGVGSPSFSSPPTSYHNRDSGTTTSHGQGPSPSHLRERRDTESHGGAPGSRPFASPTFGDPTTRSQRDVPSPNPANASGAAPGTVGSRISMSVRGRARRSKAPTIIARDRAIEKQALVESAERIYLRYLLPGAEREIYLPPSLRIQEFPSTPFNDDAPPTIPDLFHIQKVYIFKALEQDAFPRFLRAKAFGNLTPMGSFVRLILGLIVLWGGFVLAFSLIFLDYKPRLTRLWLILPFLVAFNLLLSAYYSLSPLLALFRQSETTPFHLIRIKEPYVRKLVTWRAMWIEGLCILGTAVLVVVFTVVPGHRL